MSVAAGEADVMVAREPVADAAVGEARGGNDDDGAPSPVAMRVLVVGARDVDELGSLPAALPARGVLWIAVARPALPAALASIQDALVRWGLGPLLQPHVSDLLNPQLPSHYDATSAYELLVFHRLAAGDAAGAAGAAGAPPASIGPADEAVAVETRPVGFAIFDRVLLSVHSPSCVVREHYVRRLAELAGLADAGGADARAARLPTGPAELMLRMVNHMVDSYLELRRRLTRQFAHLQQALLDPRQTGFDWRVLLDARSALHLLQDTCEEQQGAMQEWLDTHEDRAAPADEAGRREHEMLRVRARDVLEHIERVLSHVRRLEHASETALQLHFSAVGQRTNEVMRTLTVLTAIFLPLNLITGFFGMNFEGLPLIHSSLGWWIAAAMMAVIGVALGIYFRRRRYLATPRA